MKIIACRSPDLLNVLCEHNENTTWPCPCVQTCIESPNGRGCGVQCRLLQGVCGGGCLALQRQRSSQAPNTEARQRGGPAPKWCFILSASTLSFLHPGLWESALRTSSDSPWIRLCHRSSFPELQFLC